MMGSKGFRNRGVLLTWFSVFLILSGVFSWIPAAAQDGTPGSDTSNVAVPAPEPTAPPPTDPPTSVPPTAVPTVPPTTVPTDPPAVSAPRESSVQPSTSQQSLTISTLEAPIEVTAVSFTCLVVGSAIDGSLTVVNAQADTSVVLKLIAVVEEDDTEIDTLTIALVANQTEYPFTFTLDPVDFTGLAEADVEVIAFEGTSTSATQPAFAGMPRTSEPVDVNVVTGAPACAPEVNTEPGPTTIPPDEPAASPTPTPSPTATPGPASGTVRNTNGSNLRCRAEPNVSSMTLTLLPAGSRVDVRGATTNGWVPVRCSGQDGWVSATFLSVTIPPTATPTPSPGGSSFATVSNTSSNLRCRTSPVSGATIVLLPAGTRVEVRGATTNGWVPIRCGGHDGWSSAAFLTLGGPTTPGSTPTTPPVTPAPTSHATVSGTGGSTLRCRMAPVNGDTIVQLSAGSRVEVRGAVSNGWAPITCAGQAGWASVAFLLFDVGASSGELWIDVNLSTQYMRVFRGNNVIMQTFVSTGKDGFITPTGTFYINRKLPTRTMTGTLGGEYYYVPNVPSVMYFTNVGHAIHGAYWHNSFGTRRSHGCINLPLDRAAWLYSVTPVGTRLRIHY
jgi:hypothetical protein